MDRLPKLKTPLEVVDAGADVVNQVFRTPARLVGNVAGAISQAAKDLEADIRRPAEYSEIPPPPDALIEPAISGVTHMVDGAVNIAKGAVDAVVATADGIRRELQQLTGR
ncbi:hypothetical protein LCGC14_1986310 [marine sediment metagenome]|uniref:Uncharacterized protein n=1 Tax=marine sediment metagenome TaxID=412755 RepID=A0A0F9I4K4_9ZZZZ